MIKQDTNTRNTKVITRRFKWKLKIDGTKYREYANLVKIIKKKNLNSKGPLLVNFLTTTADP